MCPGSMMVVEREPAEVERRQVGEAEPGRRRNHHYCVCLNYNGPSQRIDFRQPYLDEARAPSTRP